MIPKNNVQNIENWKNWKIENWKSKFEIHEDLDEFQLSEMFRLTLLFEILEDSYLSVDLLITFRDSLQLNWF